ncbi:MAG: MFS transporter [Nocardioidaceae bacterium]
MVPLYSVYALLFGDHGVSLGQISTLFIVWSVTSFVFEIPSGAWADTIDRRHLLVLSAVIYAGSFSSWMLFQTYTGFAFGFVLWGLSSAIMSGTFESLLYDELTERGVESEYPRLIGWAHSTAMVANLLATVVAAPLFTLGGYALVGWTSVAIAGVQAGLAAALPVSTKARRPNGSHDVLGESEALVTRYVAMLRAGVREASTSVDVRRVVLIAAVLIGLTAYDEYFPLIARDHGVTTSVVPYLIGITVVGQVVGTALGGRTAGMSARMMAIVVVLGGGLISLGALVTPYAGFAAIAVGYGLLNNAMLVAGARLQQVITGPARATVTSVHGFATEVVALVVYGLFAAAAGLVSVPTLVALLGIPIVVIAWCVRRWFPGPRPSTPEPVGGAD